MGLLPSHGHGRYGFDKRHQCGRTGMRDREGLARRGLINLFLPIFSSPHLARGEINLKRES